MLSPTIISAGASELQALLQVLIDPAKYKKQVEELQQLAKDTDEKTDALIKERIQAQEVLNSLQTLDVECDLVFERAREEVRRAESLVERALKRAAETEVRAAEVVHDAKEEVQRAQIETQKALEDLEIEVNKRVQRVAELDAEIEAREGRLASAEAKLEELRSSL